MIHLFDTITKNIEESADVCVVGSGAGGASMAYELAEAGFSVILLEEGNYYTQEFFKNPHAQRKFSKLYRDAGATVLFGKPNVAYAEGRCVGGSTVLNAGVCWRIPEKVLGHWQKDHGLEDMTTEKLLPIYERVEKIISANPHIPESHNVDGDIFKRGADKLGYKYKDSLRSQKNCVGTNLCLTGCPTGAKQSTLVSYVPRFLNKGGVLYPNARVDQILTQNGKAAGVKGFVVNPVTRKKEFSFTIHSKITVISGGAVQTPALLKKSKILDAGKLTGKNLFAHPNTKVIGIFDEPVYAWKGVSQTLQITEFMDEGILMAMTFVPPSIMTLALEKYGRGFLDTLRDEYNHAVTGAALIEDSSRGQVNILPFGQIYPTYKMNEKDFKLCLRGIALLAGLYFSAGARKVYLPLLHLDTITTPDEIKKIYDYPYRPADLDLMTVHVMGTAQMGKDPTKSVVNPYGEHHEVKNLFVSDASLFPTSIGVNPQETIMSLSTRSAFYIAENRQKYLA